MSVLVDHREISHRVKENNEILEGLKHFSWVSELSLLLAPGQHIVYRILKRMHIEGLSQHIDLG
jgi:hypothetical protein